MLPGKVFGALGLAEPPVGPAQARQGEALALLVFGAGQALVVANDGVGKLTARVVQVGHKAGVGPRVQDALQLQHGLGSVVLFVRQVTAEESAGGVVIEQHFGLREGNEQVRARLAPLPGPVERDSSRDSQGEVRLSVGVQRAAAAPVHLERSAGPKEAVTQLEDVVPLLLMHHQVREH